MISEQSIPEGSNAIPPTPPYIEGFVCAGWSHDYQAINTDLIIEPIYEPNIPQKVSILDVADHLDEGEILSYSFTIETPSLITIYLESPFDSYGTLYDASMNYITEDDDNGIDANFLIDTFLESGTYFIYVEGYYGDEIGDFSLHVLIEPSIINDNGILVHKSGIIDIYNEIEYVFYVPKNSIYEIFLISDFDSYGYLMNENGYVASNDNNGDDTDFYIQTELTSGLYYLYISGYGLGNLNYELIIQKLHIEFETIETFTNTLSSDETNWEWFALTLDGKIEIELISSFSGIFEIYDSSFELINQGVSNDAIELNATGGVLYFAISGETSFDSGDYLLTIGYNPLDYELNQPIVSFSSTITSLQEKWYDISVDTAGLLLVSLISDFNGIINLYDETNTLVVSTESSSLNDFLYSYYPVVPGDYQLQLSGENLNEFGSYDLVAFLDYPDMYYLIFETDGELIAGNEDLYEFTIDYPVSLFIGTSSEFDSYGKLYDENMNLLIEVDDGWEEDFTIRYLAFPGTYYIGISGRTELDAGYYYLQVEWSEYELSYSSTIELYGYLKPSEIQDEEFELINNSLVNIHLYAIIDVTVQLYDSYDTLIFEYDLLQDSDINLPFYLKSGIYSMVFTEPSALNEGYFSCYIRNIEIYHIENPLLHLSGDIELNETLTFNFEITEVSHVIIANWSPLDTTGELYDASMNLLYSNDSDGWEDNFLIDAILDVGVYTLKVTATSVGFYDIIVDCPNDPSLEILINPSTIYTTSYLDKEDLIILPFDLNDEMNLRFYSVSDIDTYAYLYDSEGNLITECDDSVIGYNFSFYYTLAPGSYELHVTGYDETEMGLVTVLITDAINDSISNDIFHDIVGIEYSPSIVQTFIIEIIEETYVVFYADNSVDILIEILDSSNNVIASQISNANHLDEYILEILLQTGTYTVRVTSLNSIAFGIFNLSYYTYKTHQEIDIVRYTDIDSEEDDECYLFVPLILKFPTFVTAYSYGNEDTKLYLIDEHENIIGFYDDISDSNLNFSFSKLLDEGTYYLYIEMEHYGLIQMTIELDILTYPDSSNIVEETVFISESFEGVELILDEYAIIRMNVYSQSRIALLLCDIYGEMLELDMGRNPHFMIVLPPGTYWFDMLVVDIYGTSTGDSAYVDYVLDIWELTSGIELLTETIVLDYYNNGEDDYSYVEYAIDILEPSIVLVHTTSESTRLFFGIIDEYDNEYVFNFDEYSYYDLYIIRSSIWTYLLANQYEVVFVNESSNVIGFEATVIVFPISTINDELTNEITP